MNRKKNRKYRIKSREKLQKKEREMKNIRERERVCEKWSPIIIAHYLSLCKEEKSVGPWGQYYQR